MNGPLLNNIVISQAPSKYPKFLSVTSCYYIYSAIRTASKVNLFISFLTMANFISQQILKLWDLNLKEKKNIPVILTDIYIHPILVDLFLIRDYNMLSITGSNEPNH